MMFNKRSNKTTIGLYRGAARCHLVQLQRDGARYRVTQEHSADAGAQGDEPGVLAALMDRLDAKAGQGAVGLAIEGSHGLYRRVDAPPADAQATGKIIAAQVEAMIPGQMDQVSWGWVRQDAQGPAVVFTTTRRQVDRAVQDTSISQGVAAVLPQPFALDALITAAGLDARPKKMAVFAVYPRQTQLLIYGEAGLALVRTLDAGATGDDGEVERWSKRIAPLYEQAVEVLSSEQRPEAMLCLGASADTVALRESLGRRVGLTPVGWGEVCALSGLPGTELGVLVAAGAAVAAARPQMTANLLPVPQVVAPAGGLPSRRAWLAVAGWLILAVAVLFSIDMRAARQYDRAIEDSGLEESRLAELDRSLALSRYLEAQGPTFLSILDEISQKTEGFMIDEVRYERGGQMTIRGMQGSAEAVSNFAQVLAGLQTIESVQPRSQKAEGNNQISYTMVIMPSKRYFGGFVEPPAKEDKPTDAALAANHGGTADERR